MTRPAFELADIVRAQGSRFLERYGSGMDFQQRKAFRAILSCRTSALGGHVDVCPQCGYQTHSFNSCRNRSCPKCQARSRRGWNCGAGTRSAWHFLFSCCLHRAPRAQWAGTRKSASVLQPLIHRQCRHDVGGRSRPQASGCRNRNSQHPPYLGPESAVASAHPLCDSTGRPRTGSPTLDPSALPVLSAEKGSEPRVSREVPSWPEASLP